MLWQLKNYTITGILQNKTCEQVPPSTFLLLIMVRFNLGSRGVIKKLSLPFVVPGCCYTLLSEMVGVFAWNALKIFTQISSFKFWKGVLFFFFFKHWVIKACLLGRLKTRPRGLTTVLSIVAFRVVKTSDFLGLTGLSPEPSSLLTNFSLTLGQQPGPGFRD